jgi:hypothetical protein
MCCRGVRRWHSRKGKKEGGKDKGMEDRRDAMCMCVGIICKTKGRKSKVDATVAVCGKEGRKIVFGPMAVDVLIRFRV